MYFFFFGVISLGRPSSIPSTIKSIYITFLGVPCTSAHDFCSCIFCMTSCFVIRNLKLMAYSFFFLFFSLLLFLQGLAYNPKKNLLYVADTENHALRYLLKHNNLLTYIWDLKPINKLSNNRGHLICFDFIVLVNNYWHLLFKFIFYSFQERSIL